MAAKLVTRALTASKMNRKPAQAGNGNPVALFSGCSSMGLKMATRRAIWRVWHNGYEIDVGEP